MEGAEGARGPGDPPPRAGAGRLLPLLFLALAFAAVAPVFRHPDFFASPYDWRYFQSWIEVGRRTVLWFHEVPLWNRWGCGGEVLLANPQSEVAAPTFVLPLLFGTALGVKLVLVFYLFCAFDGMHRLAREEGLGREGALLAAALFGAGGWLALHLSSGHSNFASAGLFPYLVVCYRRAAAGGPRARAWAIPLGAIAAWIVALGGTSTPAMALVLLATLAAIDTARRRSWDPLLALVLGGACAALLGAARILPALEFALDHPRRQWETDRSNLLEILRNGFWWRGVEPVPGKRYWFHEYGYRLAWVSAPLLAWGLALARPRRGALGGEAEAARSSLLRRWWVVALVGGAIVAGAAIPYGPWWVLKHLPIYRDLRVPSRYALLLALALPLVAGAALEALLERLPSGRRLVAGIAIALALADGLAFSIARWDHVFDLPSRLADRSVPFHQVRGEWSAMMSVVFSGRGAIGCDEEAPLQRARELDEGDVPQVRLLDPSAGTIAAARLTANTAEIEVALARPTTVMVNQNWNEHWRASEGRVVKVGPKHPRDRDGGRLGVELPEGRRTLHLRYRPRSFTLGLWVSVVSLPALGLLWVFFGPGGQRRRARLGG